MAHATLNVKEEAANSATDLLNTVAGGNHSAEADTKFIGLTKATAHAVPTPYMVMGILGGLPYIASSGATVYLAHQAGLVASGALLSIDPAIAHTLLDQALSFQVTYGAVLLSSLGTIHWGMELAAYNGHKGYARLAIGALPLLFAVPSFGMLPLEGLLLQWVGFLSIWGADLRVAQLGWAPRWYPQYRFYLSALVGTCILGTIALTSFLGPSAGHGWTTHDIQLLRNERRKLQGESSGIANGHVGTEPDQGEHFVLVHKDQTTEEN